MCLVGIPEQVGLFEAKLPAVQSTVAVPEYPAVEHVRVQLAPLATSEEAQLLVYELVPEPPFGIDSQGLGVAAPKL